MQDTSKNNSQPYASERSECGKEGKSRPSRPRRPAKVEPHRLLKLMSVEELACRTGHCCPPSIVQLSPGDGSAEVVQIGAGQARAPRLERLLADANVLKLFHLAV